MNRIIIFGIGGRMGTAVYEALRFDKKSIVVCGIDKFADPVKYDVPIYSSLSGVTESADVIIDFSRPDALDDILDFALTRKVNLVSCTTGYTEAQQAKILEASQHIAVFQSSNMSLGVNLLIELSKTAAGFLGKGYDIEIIEEHHNKKIDAPSGTALSIAKSVNEVFDNSLDFKFGRQPDTGRRTDHEIGIHSVRGGSIVGKHEVMFIGSEEIVTLTHNAQSRSVFALGSIRASEFMLGKTEGMYSMNDLIGRDYSVTTVSSTENTALVTVNGMDDDKLLSLFDTLAEESVNVDMISQNCCPVSGINLSFSVAAEQAETALAAVKKLSDNVSIVKNTAKITVMGPGMKHQSGVAKNILRAIRKTVRVYAITTSETEIACCVDSENLSDAIAKIRSELSLEI